MKWEYKSVWLGDENKDLKELGELGWELVAVAIFNDNEPKAYFKRPNSEWVKEMQERARDEMRKAVYTSEVRPDYNYKVDYSD